MRQQKLIANPEKVTLRTMYDTPIQNYKNNYEQRMALYRANGLPRKPICSIPVDDLERLCAIGDLDALAFKNAETDGELRTAVRKLLQRFPEFRTSEARI